MKTLYIFLFVLAAIASPALHSQNLLQTQGGAIFSPANDSTPASAQLTPATQYSYGAVYLGAPQNLNNPLTYEFDMMLGQNDGGADGIVFMLHNDPRGQLAHGDVGMGLGYASSPNTQDHMVGVSSSVSNSIAIEFDTYQNSNKNDPSEDHIAFVKNGDNDHSKYPNSYLKKISNIEDGQFHRFKFVWNPTTNNVRVYLDNVQMLSINTNIRTIIGGNIAYIGFSGTTGALVNTQTVRDVSSPLPVELTRFDAQYNNDLNAVQLGWTTLSETNNNYFSIEKSDDGVLFTEIGKVVGAGNSNTIEDYDFVDYNYNGSLVFYRLKQVDFDGKYEYSNIVAVDNSGIANESSIISAVAENGFLNLNLFAGTAGNYSVQIFDLSGKMVSELNAGLDEGVSAISVPVNNNAQGLIYIVSVSDNAGWNAVQKTFMQ